MNCQPKKLVDKLVEVVHATLVSEQRDMKCSDFVPETSSEVVDMELSYTAEGCTVKASRLHVKVLVNPPTLGLSV